MKHKKFFRTVPGGAWDLNFLGGLKVCTAVAFAVAVAADAIAPGLGVAIAAAPAIDLGAIVLAGSIMT